jgi:S1-C subfamily serine protease
VALLVGGAILTVVLLKDSPEKKEFASNPPVEKPPVKKQEDKIREIVIQPPIIRDNNKPPDSDSKVPPSSEHKDITEDKAVIEKVKRAAVYIEVTDSSNRKFSGSGFFGAPGARNIVLTNAHVVGMLAPDSRPPKNVKVFINSGQHDERGLGALVLGVDRDSDLAVLDVSVTEGLPEPLNVATSETLHDLQKLWVFGFPLGKSLGKEITMRDTSISSFRKKDGLLDKIQVNGGMDPGNSGGPVVDANGNVVGVSVSGIPGRQINFAIPGERVHAILAGRITTMGTGMPYIAEGNHVGYSVNISMIDPRKLIKEVGLDVWTGDRGNGKRPPVKGTAPAPAPGDSSRQRVKLNYEAPVGRGEVILPELPPGKVYWVQPCWVNANGETQWAGASHYNLDPASPPVERKPAALVLRNQANAKRDLTLKLNATFRVGSDEDTDVASLIGGAGFKETVTQVDSSGAVMDLQYKTAQREYVLNKTDKRKSPLLEKITKDKILPVMKVSLSVDPLGNLSFNKLDPRPFGNNQQAFKLAQQFHEPNGAALEALSVPMPFKKAGETTAPGETWKSERSLPIDSPGKYENGKVNMTYTFLGVRKRDGRDEAVISMDGVVSGGSAETAIGGRASGLALLDLSSGIITTAKTNVVVDMEATLSELDDAKDVLRVIATYDFRLDRTR